MGFTLRTVDPQRKFSSQITMQAIEQAIPLATIEAVLTQEHAWHKRERKLPMTLVVLIVIAMSLYRDLAIAHVMRRLVQGLRFIWPDDTYAVPKASAFTYRRYNLGPKPMERLFKPVARLVATTGTLGAFLLGRRLMAIDGTVLSLPDTEANEAWFGRHKTGRGRTAFPQARSVFLVECGTHVVCDAGFWRIDQSECIGGLRLLRSLGPAHLVMWDRGLHSFEMFKRAIDRGVEVLSRLPAHVKPEPIMNLPDGSQRVRLRASDYARRSQGEHVVLCLIEYTIDDHALPGHGERHRLLTTLLDHEQAPAQELACAYHERWEAELVIETHELFAQPEALGRVAGALRAALGAFCCTLADA